MNESYYNSDTALAEYLAFHYAAPHDYLPFEEGPQDALHFPKRCVSEMIRSSLLPENSRALDLGCAVGGASFELSRICREVIGIDRSPLFIETAEKLRQAGSLTFNFPVEGSHGYSLTVHRPLQCFPERIHFEVGDALNLPASLGCFDLVLAANLVDRVPHPRKLLESFQFLLIPGGQLILTSPYTWLETYTPKSEWLTTETESAFQTIHQILSPAFELLEKKNLPFLIREHARKYQWSLAEATLWQRRSSLLLAA